MPASDSGLRCPRTAGLDGRAHREPTLSAWGPRAWGVPMSRARCPSSLEPGSPWDEKEGRGCGVCPQALEFGSGLGVQRKEVRRAQPGC